MATNDQDLARVAVGDILDQARSDVRALLAQARARIPRRARGRVRHGARAARACGHGSAAARRRAIARGSPCRHQTTSKAPRATSLRQRLGPTSIVPHRSRTKCSRAGLSELAASALLSSRASRAGRSNHGRCRRRPAPALGAHWRYGRRRAAFASGRPTDSLVARLAAETSATSEESAIAAPRMRIGRPTDRITRGACVRCGARREHDPTWRRAGRGPRSDPSEDYVSAQLRTRTSPRRNRAGDRGRPRRRFRCQIGAARLRAAYGLIEHGQTRLGDSHPAAGRRLVQSLALAEALGEALAAADPLGGPRFAVRRDRCGPRRAHSTARSHSSQCPRVGRSRGAVTSVEDGREPRQGRVAALTAAALEAWRTSSRRPPMRQNSRRLRWCSRPVGERDVARRGVGARSGCRSSPWADESLALRRARLYSDDTGPRGVNP